MGKVVVIGSANTDMVVESDRFPAPGETILGGRFFMNSGGNGATWQRLLAAPQGPVSILVTPEKFISEKLPDRPARSRSGRSDYPCLQPGRFYNVRSGYTRF